MGMKTLLKARSLEEVLQEVWNISWYWFTRIVFWIQVSAILRRAITLLENGINTPNLINSLVHRCLIYFFKASAATSTTPEHSLVIHSRDELITHVDAYVATCYTFRHPIRILNIILPVSIPWCALLQWNLPVMNTWNVERVTEFNLVFANIRNPHMHSHFNEYLGDWNVTNAVDMSFMFRGATQFQGLGLNRWELGIRSNSISSSVEGEQEQQKSIQMRHMFDGCSQFNVDLSKWNTSSVTDMSHMFEQARLFQGHGMENWDVSSVTNMANMMKATTQFNADLSSWDVTNVKSMEAMFFYSKQYDGKGIEQWNITRETTNTKRMFVGANKIDRKMPFGTLL